MSWHAFILILRHVSFIVILWNFKFIVMNRKHIQTEKMLKFFQKKKTYLTSILVRLRMSLRVVFTYIILFFFFWKSLKVFKISLILLSFLKNLSCKIRKSPLEFSLFSLTLSLSNLWETYISCLKGTHCRAAIGAIFLWQGRNLLVGTIFSPDTKELRRKTASKMFIFDFFTKVSECSTLPRCSIKNSYIFWKTHEK